MFQSHYERHEYIYIANPTRSGWNNAKVDQIILSYIDELLQQAQITPPATILELGCGMGNLTLPLSHAGFHMVGIDISTTAIEVAIKRAFLGGYDARFLVGNVILADTYQELEKFDCVLDGLCWHCIIGQDRRILLNFVRRVLMDN